MFYETCSRRQIRVSIGKNVFNSTAPRKCLLAFGDYEFMMSEYMHRARYLLVYIEGDSENYTQQNNVNAEISARPHLEKEKPKKAKVLIIITLPA